MFPTQAGVFESVDWSSVREWLTAIGTVAAAVVALWLAKSDARKARQENEKRARLYAAGMVARLAHTRDIIRNCGAICAFAEPPAPPDRLQQNLGRVVRNIQSQLQKQRFEPSMEALVAMVALGNNTASRIAKAFDQIKRIETEVLAYSVLEAPLVLGRRDNLPELITQWGRGFSEAIDLLNVSISDCAAAANIAAPAPSDEEMGYTDGHVDDP